MPPCCLLANTVCGGAIANVAIQGRRRHPHADRPLIAFDVAAIFEPMTLAGTVIGVLLNTLLPGWLTTVLLVALLTYTAHKTLKKGYAAWQAEGRRVAAAERVELPAPILAGAKLWVRQAREALHQKRHPDDVRYSPHGPMTSRVHVDLRQAERVPSPLLAAAR